MRPKTAIGMTGGPKPMPGGIRPVSTAGYAPSGPKTGIGMTGGPKPALGGIQPISTAGAAGGIKTGVNPVAKPAAMKKGGKVGSASKRADGCAIKGKTRGKIV